jgi:hypothetical protein
MVSFTSPAALPPDKEPPPPLPVGLEAEWAQNRSGRCGVEKKTYPFAGNRTRAVQPVDRR